MLKDFVRSKLILPSLKKKSFYPFSRSVDCSVYLAPPRSVDRSFSLLLFPKDMSVQNYLALPLCSSDDVSSARQASSS